MLPVLLLIIISILIIFWFFLRNRNLSELPPEYPKNWPILGIAHVLYGDTKHLLKCITDLGDGCIKQGGVNRFNMGPFDCYGVANPEDAMTVMNTCLEKKWVYDFGKPWFGDGLITVTNLEKWKCHRKIANRAFNQQVLDGFMGVFNNQSRHLIKAFSTKVNGESFDHSHILEDFALQTMYQTTMGFNEEEIAEFLDEEHKNATRAMMNIIAKRFQTFWMYNQFIFNMTSLKKKQDEVLTVLHRISNTVIERKREILKINGSPRVKFTSFLDLLLGLPPQEAFTDQEIKEEVDTMITAGSDTSATTLTYALMLLGTHQVIQEKVNEELKQVFEESLRDVEKQDLSRLVLVEAVLLETLRLYPILPVLPRYVAENVKLKNYTITADSTCLMFVGSMQRDPAVWGSDAAEFCPERWLRPGVPPTNSFAAFSLGKRGCIVLLLELPADVFPEHYNLGLFKARVNRHLLGKTYALMSMKTTLAHVLRHYKITADISKLVLQFDMIQKPASGCEIRLKPRSVKLE